MWQKDAAKGPEVKKKKQSKSMTAKKPWLKLPDLNPVPQDWKV